MHELLDLEVVKKYEPSSECKERWLYTRKKKLEFEDVVLDGFYFTHKYKRDLALFGLVVCLEAYGMYALWNVLPNPLLSLAALPLDLFCAVMAHLYKKKLLIAKTKKALAHYGGISFTEGKAAQFENDFQKKVIFRIKLYEFVWYFLICLLALIKAISIFSYASLVFVVKLCFLAMYATTAIIHITTTGYLFAEWFFRYKVWREKKNLGYTKDKDLPKNNQAVIMYRRYNLHELFEDVSVGMQKVFTEKANPIESTFYNWGILQDDELLNLVEAQGEISKKQSLAVKLLSFQYASLKSEANRIDKIVNIEEEIDKIKASVS
ncbi:MAG TPA: hypothetical protein VHE59_16270 [Mucilaginibacter sp.]|nr:hypothetical protein [Mucilaginibacter sp.]